MFFSSRTSRRTGFRPCLETLEDRTLLSQSAIQVLDINPGTFSSNPTNLVDLNGTLLFAANDGVHGNELWKTNGTANGTSLVRDIYVGSTSQNPSGSSNPTGLTIYNGFVYFAANSNNLGVELWRSNGTAAATTLVLDINPGVSGNPAQPNNSNPANFTVFNGLLYFTADDGVHGTELWKTDGTPGGTSLFADVNPGPNPSNPSNLTVAGNKLYFIANDGSRGVELWDTDGTTTNLVKDINIGAGGSFPSQLTAFNGKLYFAANDGIHGRELWVSDGTTPGTNLFADINTTSATASSTPTGLTVSGSRLFFAATDGINGVQLWATDGTNSPLMVGGRINATGDANPTNLTDVNGTLFFAANDGVHGNELWTSNGTTSTLVVDLNTATAAASSNPSQLVNFRGTLFFAANDGIHGNELWKSDGTAPGTVLIRDINPGGSSNPTQLTVVAGKTLFFRANDGTSGAELWKVINDFIVTGADFGSLPTVNVYDGVTGQLIRSFLAYNSAFRGGVRVTTGDVNGDGIPDIITAPGTNGGPDIRIWDGVSGKSIGEFFAYDPNFLGGVYVASADLTGDGLADIITSPDQSGGPDVRVFSGDTGALVQEFFAYDPRFLGGVRVAVGDINKDGVPDIITAPGPSGGPDIRVWEGNTSALIQEFFAYDPSFLGGVYVSAGDLNNDGVADIVTGAGAGMAPQVKVFDGTNPNNLLTSFNAYASNFTGGVRVAVLGDVNQDNHQEIATTPGSGLGPEIKAFEGLNPALVLDDFFANPATDQNGLFVGASHS